MLRFFLSVVFVLGFLEATRATPPSVIVVQYRPRNGDVTVAREGGRTEHITLQPEYKKSAEPTAQQLRGLFARLYEEGYLLQNSVSYGVINSDDIVTYVFVKPATSAEK